MRVKDVVLEKPYSLPYEEQNCVNVRWKPFICYSFNRYIICHTGYRPYEQKDFERNRVSLFPRTIY